MTQIPDSAKRKIEEECKRFFTGVLPDPYIKLHSRDYLDSLGQRFKGGAEFGYHLAKSEISEALASPGLRTGSPEELAAWELGRQSLATQLLRGGK